MQRIVCIALCAVLLPLCALSKRNPFAPSSAPTAFTATGGDTKITLNWSQPLNNGGSAVTSYKIYRGTRAGGSKNLIKTVASTVYSIIDEGKVNGTQYFYTIKAVNLSGDGESSPEVNAIPGVQTVDTLPTATPPGNISTQQPVTDTSGQTATTPPPSSTDTLPTPPSTDTSAPVVTPPATDTTQVPSKDSTQIPTTTPEPDNGDYTTTFNIVSGKANPWDSTAVDQQGYMYTPAGYNNGNKRKYPAIIFLHGLGEVGRNQVKLLVNEGLPYLINNGMKPDSCLIFCPQLPYGSWTKAKIEVAMNWIIANYRIDTTRIYVTGLSLGANGTFEALKGIGNRVAAAISSNGFNNGPASLTTSNYSMLWNVPVLFIGGDKDVTIPFDYTDKTTIPVVTSVYYSNARKDPTLIPMELLCIKGGTHSRNVWNDNCYDISKAPFNFINWFLQYSKDKAYTATRQVELMERFVSLKKFDQALFKYQTALTYVNQLAAGDDKTKLSDRLANACLQLNNAGKRYIIKFGNSVTDASYNYLLNGATGQTVSALKDMTSKQTSTYKFTITKQASTTTSFTTDNTVFNHNYLGLTKGFLQNGFVATAAGGCYEFSGLDNTKTYRLVAFGAYNHTTPSTPADLTIVVDSTVKTLFTNTTSVNWIEFSNIKPVQGKVTFMVKGSPSYKNVDLVSKTETGSSQTTASNIVGYNYNAYINGVMLVENPPTASTTQRTMLMQQRQTLEAAVPAVAKEEVLQTSIYPNPVSGGALNVQLASNVNGTASVSVYNMEGKLMRMQSFQTIGKGNLLTLNVSNLPKGLYLAKIAAAGSFVTHKVVIQ
ncbi:T9SS type A sorting domain-containing protein [Danxiaibacter flavus]|uniref:T9SS type A sorting domain-containing protein n=1 Tax=Danxiaibacter flavus TaxID=3049108 RepID=A0ABV3ZGK3_9BACT|nr:T9SS type A sorting domain-containing protein [Chitinophagaceae bacterium DXS]